MHVKLRRCGHICPAATLRKGAGTKMVCCAKKSAFAAPAIRRESCCKGHGGELATKRQVNMVRRLCLFKYP